MSRFVEFNIVPHKRIEPGKQVLLRELAHHHVAHYEGESSIADALFIWALAGLENDKNVTPILLVNEDDFLLGHYGEFPKSQDDA